MKFRFILLFLLGGGAFLSNNVSAQLVGDQIFMQGKWLEVGVAPNGAWGNTRTVPAGYHTHTGSSLSLPDPITGSPASGDGLDFSYDPGHDGWATGSPGGAASGFYGAFFLPGTPFDGWSIQMNGVRSDAYYTSSPSGFTLGAGATSFSGTNTAYSLVPPSTSACGTVTGSSMRGEWNGTYVVSGQTLNIHITNRLDTNASWDIVTVVLKNNGAAPIPDVYYMATGDPDNDEVIPGSFPTNNHISYQNDFYHRVEVNARPPSIHQDAFSGLAAKDCRSKALIYSSWPSGIAGNGLDLIYSGTAGSLGTTEYTNGNSTLAEDWAYAIVFKAGTIAPGDSAVLSFAWIFSDTTAVDSAFPQPRILTQCFARDSLDTVIGCSVTGSTFPVDILNANEKNWTKSSWTWAPSTGLSATTGTSVTVSLTSITAPTTFTITGTDVASCAQKTFLLYVTPCFSASSNSPGPTLIDEICVDDTLRLVAHGDSLGATYVWHEHTVGGPVVGTLQSIKIPHITMADSGWYYVIKTLGTEHDTVSTHVLIKPKPVINASSNGPICSGNTLVLTSSPDSVGETWSWSGPLGFTSVLSDPIRPTAITAYSGLYKVIASFNGCIDSATVTVVVDSTPTVPVVGSNSPVCSGDTLKLTSTEATAGVSYSWAGPGGFTSTLANPVIPNVTIAANGTYTLTVRLGTCTNTNTTDVIIDATPVPVLGSNSPVCSGNPLNLNTTGPAGSTFSWVGPNLFTSVFQNPTINPATTAATGTYSVIVTAIYPLPTPHGCPSAVTTIYAVVDTTPEMPTVGTNSPGPPGPTICQGDTLKLFANSATGGTGYIWGGPNSFSSTLANPIIYPAMPAATGFYTVIVTMGACTVSATISATVTPTPPLTATSNSPISAPICTGIYDTLFLQANSGPGAAYSWSGPYVFTSSAQNPTRTPVVTEFAGVYNVSVLLNGCTNHTSFVVPINETPPPPWVKWITYCQGYDAPAMQAYGTNILWYGSSAGGVATPTPPVPPTDTVGWKFYYVTQTVANCVSAIDSIKVQVNPKPTVSIANPSVQVCPRDSVLLTAVDTTDQVVYYHWTPNMYAQDTTSSTAIMRPETDMVYSVIVTNQYNCPDTATAYVTVRPGAVITLADSVTLFTGETFQMDTRSNCTTFRWTPYGGLNSVYIMDPVASPEVSTRYFVTGITEWGCKTKDSIDVIINTEGELAVPNAFAPGNGPNGIFKILKRGVATLNHFRIYDRWGVVVFEAKNIDDGWDGTYKGVPQPMGVYVYEISAVSSTTGRQFIKKGNITLLR